MIDDSHIHTYIYLHMFFFNILFHHGLSQKMRYSSLCCTAWPCRLSILNVIVCIYQPSSIEFWSKAVCFWADNYSFFKKILAFLKYCVESEHFTVFGSPESQLWDGDQCTGGVLGTALGHNNCRRVKESGLRKGRSWTVMQLQKRPQLVTQRILVSKCLYKVVLPWRGKGARYCHINQVLNVSFPQGGGKILNKATSIGFGKFPEGDQLWPCSCNECHYTRLVMSVSVLDWGRRARRHNICYTADSKWLCGLSFLSWIECSLISV